MSESEQLNSLIQNVLSRFNKQCTNGGKSDDSKHGECGPTLTPQQLLVIAGILGGVLQVDSLLLSRDQHVEIVLVGTFRQETQLEKVISQIGSLPFNEVLKAMVGRMF